MAVAEAVEGEVAAKGLARLDGDAADSEEPIDLGLREAARRLVGGDSVFVEAAGFGAGVKDCHIMAVHRQTVRAGEACGAGADDRDTLAGPGRAGEGVALRHRGIGGKALQAADLDRLALGRLAHAGLFAQGFGRADAGAHAAEDVLLPDRLRGSLCRAGGDLADEEGDVDGGRAGRHAGRVIAEIAAVGGHPRLVPVERGLVVGEVRLIGGGGQTPRHNAGRQRAVRHGADAPCLSFSKRCHRDVILSNGKFLGRLHRWAVARKSGS